MVSMAPGVCPRFIIIRAHHPRMSSPRDLEPLCRSAPTVFSCFCHFTQCPGNLISLIVGLIGLFWVAGSSEAGTICYCSTILFPITQTIRVLWIGEDGGPIYSLERLVIYWTLMISMFLFDHLLGFMSEQPFPLYFLVKTLFLNWCAVADQYNGIRFLRDVRDRVRWNCAGAKPPVADLKKPALKTTSIEISAVKNGHLPDVLLIEQSPLAQQDSADLGSVEDSLLIGQQTSEEPKKGKNKKADSDLSVDTVEPKKKKKNSDSQKKHKKTKDAKKKKK